LPRKGFEKLARQVRQEPTPAASATLRHTRSLSRHFIERPFVQVERIMLGYLIDMAKDIVLPCLICWTEMLLDRAEHSRRDAYLASCADIGELERRMRTCEFDA
jgi:hypothetical protein